MRGEKGRFEAALRLGLIARLVPGVTQKKDCSCVCVGLRSTYHVCLCVKHLESKLKIEERGDLRKQG